MSRMMRVFTTVSGERLAIRSFDVSRVESVNSRTTKLVYSTHNQENTHEKEVFVLGSFDAVLSEVESHEVKSPWEQ